MLARFGLRSASAYSSLHPSSTNGGQLAHLGHALTVEGAGGKSLQRKFKGKVVFVVGDKEAPATYSLDLSSPTSCGVSEGDTFGGKEDLRVSCSEDVMVKMINKAIQPQQAFMKGLLKIKGKMSLAMKLNSVLAATRKKLPSSKL